MLSISVSPRTFNRATPDQEILCSLLVLKMSYHLISGHKMKEIDSWLRRFWHYLEHILIRFTHAHEVMGKSCCCLSCKALTGGVKTTSFSRKQNKRLFLFLAACFSSVFLFVWSEVLRNMLSCSYLCFISPLLDRSITVVIKGFVNSELQYGFFGFVWGFSWGGFFGEGWWFLVFIKHCISGMNYLVQVGSGSFFVVSHTQIFCSLLISRGRLRYVTRVKLQANWELHLSA